jgi:hypothetical protein
MRTERILTRHGGFLEIIVPEDFEFANVDVPTGDDMIAASVRYMAKVYRDASQRIAVATTFANVAMISYAETLDIMNDKETMDAIAEGQENKDEVQPNESA